MPGGLRVCILTSVHGALDTRIFRKEAKSLVDAGYEVVLIAQHGRDEVVDGVRITALREPGNRLLRMLGVAGLLILAYRQHARVYHLHDPELLPAGLLLKALTRAKVVYDAHEDYPALIPYKHWVPRPLRRPLSWWFNLAEKRMATRLDCVIAAIDDIASQFRGVKAITIQNYPIVSCLHTILPHTARKARMIYVGALTRGRGITELVQAMGYLNPSLDISLVLCGKFDPPVYEHRVRSMEGFDKVEYLGWCAYEDIEPQLAEAAMGMACLHPEPNYVCTIPTKVFEYMEAGLPVVVSNFPKLRELVETTGSGLAVDPLDPGEIAEAVEFLVENPEEARRMGENGRKAVLEKYNWEREGMKLLALYEDLVSVDRSVR